jgi:hypothetical protein
MTFNDLKAKITGNVQKVKAIIAPLGKEFSESDNKIAFIKEAFSREIVQKKERIPGAIITGWFLILFIFCYDWTFGMNWSMVFNLGVLPLIIYYIVRTIREAPSS